MFNANLKWGGYKTPRQFPLIAAVAALLLFIAAIVFSGCAGGAGGSSADAEEEGTIALKLSAPATGSRSARAAESIWNTATGTFSVSLKSDLYSDTQSVELSTDPDSPRSITFKSVPVGLTVTISATFTGTFDGAPETKTYSDRVTKTVHSGSNVITLNMTEDGGRKKSIPAPRITYSKTDYTSTSVAGCASVTFQIQNIADFTGLDYTAAWTFTAVSIKRSTGNVERTATLRSTEKSVTIDKSTFFSVAGGVSDRSMVVGSSTRLGTLKAELTVTVDGTPYTATAVTLDAVNDLGYRTAWD